MEPKKNKKEVRAEEALSKVQFICSKQEKCCFDIRKKLKSWNISPDEQDEIIQSLTEDKFINEERYTTFYVRDKFRFNKWGRIKIAHHLRQKQIPEYIISNTLDQLDDVEYFENLHGLLINKMKNIREEDSYQLRAKLFRFAQSRGFESQISLKLIDKIILEMN